MWPVTEAVWLGFVLTLAAWVWGSFLNQLVDRMPRRGSAPGRHGQGKSTQPSRATVLRPSRSICLDCGVGIPWYDNLPVISYLLLRGACRRCGASIGLRTLVMEVATPVAFAGLYALRLGSGAAPWIAALEYLLLSWLLPAAALLKERRGLGAGMAGAGAALGLTWLLLFWRT